MAPFTLRCAELTDVQTLVDLRIAYLREVEHLPAEDDTPALVAATRRYFMRKMPPGEYIAWVALARPAAATESRGVLRSKVIGTAGMFLYDRPPNQSGGGREARLVNVYVTESWRGRGVGNDLIDACLESARRAGVHRVLVDDSPTGRRLYERAGFTVVNTIMELVW
ncbi:MAG: GNAT family N-acetyltransferase [Gemmatimonadota bacterium]